MTSFDYLWQLLNPKSEYATMRNYCQKIWDTFPVEKQRLIYLNIQAKKEKGLFVDFNPFYAIQKNASPPKQQTLTFAEYYAKYGTTLEQDGWKMTNPTGQQVIYVKN